MLSRSSLFEADQYNDKARLNWPNDLGRRFLITVDTEEEFDWSAPFERSGHTTITVPMLQRYQQFVQKYGIKPVYFVDYSIINDDEATAFLRDASTRGDAFVGAHLHPWINPPFEEELTAQNSFAGNLPIELEEAKIVALRDTIEQRIGVRTKIYRAGRYGVGPNTVEILLKHGFTIDSSIRSRFDYSGEGGPNFQNMGPVPMWLDEDKSLLELPLTSIFSGVFRQQSEWLAPWMNRSSITNAILSKSKLLERIPLTPEGVSAREAKEAIDVALDDDLQLLVFSFHSPSLSPGHTPYVRTMKDLDAFYDWWRKIISHLKDRNVLPIGIDELTDSIG